MSDPPQLFVWVVEELAREIHFLAEEWSAAPTPEEKSKFWEQLCASVSLFCKLHGLVVRWNDLYGAVRE